MSPFGFNTPPSGNTYGANQLSQIARGLTGHYQMSPDSWKSYDLTNTYNSGLGWLSDYNAYDVKGQILKQVGGTLESRTNLLRELRNVKDNELVQTLISVLVDDAFSSISDSSFLSVEYNTGEDRKSKLNDEIQDEIDKFIVDQDLTGLARDFVEDWMLQGEYFLKTNVVKGAGIVEILDDCDTEDYLAIYRGRKLDSYFKFNRKKGIYQLLDNNELSHFVLDGSKIRVKVDTNSGFENIPENIRVGKSIIYPVLSSLRKLNVLETTSLAVELKRVLAPILVSVDIDPDTDVHNISDLVDKYEGILNSMNADAENIDTFSISDILHIASRIRVVPRMTDSKGNIEQIRFDFDNTDLNNRINDIRKNIALAIGVPSFYLSYGDQMLNKTEMLKVYSAYSRKLINIQNNFGNGIRNIIYKHLFYKGYYVSEGNIKIKFKSITNVDMLDDIEVLVAVMTTLRDFFGLASEIEASEQFGITADQDKLIDFFDSFTSSFPKLQGMFKLYGEDSKQALIDKMKRGGDFEIPKSTVTKREPTKVSTPGATLSTRVATPSPTTTPTTTPARGTQPSPATPPPPETGGGGEVSIGDVF